MAVTTNTAVKAHMGYTATDLDSILTTWIAQCEAAISRYIKRQISQATITEYLGGTGTQALWLRKTPVQSITSLYLDDSGYAGQGSGSFPESSLLTAGEDYALDVDQPVVENGIASMSGRVWRIGTYWNQPRARVGLLNSVSGNAIGNIKATYVAGWTDALMPHDLALAATEMVVQIRNQRGDGMPLQSEGMDYYNYTRVSPAEMSKVLGSVESILASFRKVVV